MLEVARFVISLTLLAVAGCDEQTRQSPALERHLLIFDDPGPTPTRVDRLFTGSNRESPVEAPNGDIAVSLIACGATEFKINDADRDHTWSITTPRPSDAASFITCVSRHAGPQVFRVRSVTSRNGS